MAGRSIQRGNGHVYYCGDSLDYNDCDWRYAVKITNKYKLPEPLVSVVKNDPYPTEADWDISTTSLIAPPQIVQLRKRHRAEKPF